MRWLARLASNRNRRMAALLLAVAGVTACGRASGPRPVESPDAIAGLDATQAYLTGVQLLNQRRQATASLPYFRRALTLRPDLWQIHHDYAAALLNAANEAQMKLGETRRVTRSSWEGVAMIHEALAEIDRAEALASLPSDRAHAIAMRAQALAVWGMSWNGLAEYWRAQKLDPASNELRGRRAQLLRIARDPLWGRSESLPGEEDP